MAKTNSGSSLEDFDIDLNRKTDVTELNMQVSLACQKDGQKVVYVMFSDGERSAEGEIPKCRIISNRGFSQEEVTRLESYLKENSDMLYKTAAGIDPIRALFS